MNEFARDNINIFTPEVTKEDIDKAVALLQKENLLNCQERFPAGYIRRPQTQIIWQIRVDLKAPVTQLNNRAVKVQC